MRKFLRNRKGFFSKAAQSIAELAIFGAILVFVLGLIIRYVAGINMNQTAQLKAMRLAMKMSYAETADGNNPDFYDTKRKTASVVLIEDRAEVGTRKFGPQKRSSVVASGSGTYTKLLMMPTLEGSDPPVLDLFINGEQFPLTTAEFRTIRLAYIDTKGTVERKDDEIFPCHPNAATEDVGPNSLSFYGIEDAMLCDPNIDFRPYWAENCTYWRAHKKYYGCVVLLNKIINNPSDQRSYFCKNVNTPGCHPDDIDKPWEMDIYDRFNLDRSGTRMYPWGPDPSVISGFDPYDPSTWDDVPDNQCDYEPDRGYCDALFDGCTEWDDSGTPGDRSDDICLNGEAGGYPWQWNKFKGTNYKIGFKEGRFSSFDIDFDGKEETLIEFRDMFGRHTTVYRDQKDPYKANGDMDRNSNWKKGEPAKKLEETTVIEVVVLDFQEGDWDTTYNDLDKKKWEQQAPPGSPAPPTLKQETRMYTFSNVSQGWIKRIAERDTRLIPFPRTYLLIEEGKLFQTDPNNPSDRQFIRNTRRTDRADIIERQIQLSNDTGRLCVNPQDTSRIRNQDNTFTEIVCCCPDSGDGCPTSDVREDSNYQCNPNAGDPTNASDPGCYYQVDGIAYRHCFDRDSKILYIRSNILEQRGRKWITDVEDDRLWFDN